MKISERKLLRMDINIVFIEKAINEVVNTIRATDYIIIYKSYLNK